MRVDTTGLSTPTPVDLPSSYKINANYFEYQSPKMHRNMGFYSELEYHHGLLQEGTPEVVEYLPQPKAIFIDDRPYVFDCWLRWDDRRQELREIKDYANLVLNAQGDHVPPRWDEIVAWCKGENCISNFVTERHLAPFALKIRNWQRLVPYVLEAQESPHPDVEKLVTHAVGETPRITVGLLCRAFAATRQGTVLAAVAKLLHAGRLLADLEHDRFGPALQLAVNLSRASA